MSIQHQTNTSHAWYVNTTTKRYVFFSTLPRKMSEFDPDAQPPAAACKRVAHCTYRAPIQTTTLTCGRLRICPCEAAPFHHGFGGGPQFGGKRLTAIHARATFLSSAAAHATLRVFMRFISLTANLCTNILFLRLCFCVLRFGILPPIAENTGAHSGTTQEN